MADDNITKDKDGNVVSVKLDKVLVQGDEGWGLHNPVPRDTDTLSVHDSDEDPGEAAQVDIPQTEPVQSDELYVVKDEDVPSQEPAEPTESKSASKSDSSSKS